MKRISASYNPECAFCTLFFLFILRFSNAYSKIPRLYSGSTHRLTPPPYFAVPEGFFDKIPECLRDAVDVIGATKWARVPDRDKMDVRTTLF